MTPSMQQTKQVVTSLPEYTGSPAPLLFMHHNDPKFLNRQVQANRVDPDPTAQIREAVRSQTSLFAIPSVPLGGIIPW